VIHRDLKPKNIILTREGQVKITDFGLAKQVSKEPETTTVAGRGTLYYMSPEQVRGGKEVTHLTDIYAIGMTLYEMLTGKRPFDQTDSQYTPEQRIVEGKVAPPSVFNPDLDPKLEKIILKAIHHRPDRRYQSAEEMLGELGRYFEDTDVPDPKPRKGDKKKVDWNRLVNMKYIIPAFTILLVLVIVVLMLQNGEDNVSEDNSKKSEVREDNSPEQPPIVQPPVQRPTHGIEEISQALAANKLRSGDKLLRIAFVNNNDQLQKVLKKIDFRQTWILWSALKSDPVRRYLYLAIDSQNTPEKMIHQFALSEVVPGQTRFPVETVYQINNQIVFTLDRFITQ
jgi:serine/threonine protein kinase